MRVDVRLTVGALQETVLVSGHGSGASDRERRGAVADDERADGEPADQRPLLSELHRADARRGAALHDPGRRHQQPRSVDGRLGQRPAAEQHAFSGSTAPRRPTSGIPDIQSYSPALEAIETVSVVTNSFDADQGMAGGAAVNVQVKSGTNSFSGSLFEYLTTTRLKSRPYFLPASADKGSDNKNVFGGTIGRTDRAQQAVLLRQRREQCRRVKDGTVQLAEGEMSTGTTGPEFAAAGGPAHRRISPNTGHGDLRSADRHRRRARDACRLHSRTARD